VAQTGERRFTTNQDVAELLRDVAVAYQIKGLNRFQIQAYDSAAAGIEHTTRGLREIAAEGRLQEIPGVGPGIAGYLDELLLTGRVQHFDEVFAGIPEAVFDLVRIPGVGPATAQKLAAAGVEDLRDLEMKLENGALRGKGLGDKALARLEGGLAELRRRSDRMLLPRAEGLAGELLRHLRAHPAVEQAEAAGSLRRRVATVGDLDIVVSTRSPEAVVRHFLAFEGAHSVIDAGDTAASILLQSGTHVDVLTGSPDTWGALLHHFTGSKQHNIHMRRIAQQAGYSISERGVKVLQSGDTIPIPREEDVYALLGMDTPPPELREDTGEIEAAQSHRLPPLVAAARIRGDCHTHTTWSDGRGSAAEMVEAARGLGREYVVITDHSYPSLDYTARAAELEALDSAVSGMRVLNGLEVNITSEGGLQIPDDVLSRHAFCLGSIHSSFRQPRDVMTARLLAALAHPAINGIAHPTARLINSREGIDADWDAVMSACLQYDKFLEIDGWPDRLDLPENLVREAVRRGVKLIVDSDAHATDQLSMLAYGVDVARRGGASASNILNTLPFDDFLREARVRLGAR
jgi:DNA polymerase (family 10)